jgi:hypothetical protein
MVGTIERQLSRRVLAFIVNSRKYASSSRAVCRCRAAMSCHGGKRVAAPFEMPVELVAVPAHEAVMQH